MQNHHFLFFASNSKIVKLFLMLFLLSFNVLAISTKDFSVKDFGANGDGKTDNRLAIQATIDAVHNIGGGTVLFPEGIFIVNAPNKAEWQPQLRLYNNIKIIGAGISKTVIKVADNQGAWDVIFSGESIENFSMLDLTLDGNGATNPVITTIDAVPSPWYHTLVYLPNAKNIAIQRCQFTNLSGVWAVYALKRAENLVIDSCIFDNIGGFTKNDWDHSCIRIDGNGPVVVSNNILTSRFGSGTTGVRTAVEIHGSNHKFINNTITGFRGGINVCSGGDEKVNEPSVHQYYIGNKMVNVGCGFNIWGIENRTFDNLVFERNDITIDITGWKDVYPEFYGIGLVTYNVNYIPLIIENMKIIDNNITFINNEGGNKYTFGLRLVSNNLDSTYNFNKISQMINCQIARNTISGAYLNGIYINCKSKNLEITDNVIIDPGIGTNNQEWKSAIKLLNEMDNVSITKNRFYSHQKTPISCGIYDESFSKNNCYYSDNQIINFKNQSIPMYLKATNKNNIFNQKSLHKSKVK